MLYILQVVHSIILVAFVLLSNTRDSSEPPPPPRTLELSTTIMLSSLLLLMKIPFLTLVHLLKKKEKKIELIHYTYTAGKYRNVVCATTTTTTIVVVKREYRKKKIFLCDIIEYASAFNLSDAFVGGNPPCIMGFILRARSWSCS